jgi:hypothetical protein
MASQVGWLQGEATAADISTETGSAQIWALVDENRQLQHRIAHVEGDVLPQLIARLTQLERAAGKPASASQTVASDNSDSRPSAAESARASFPLPLVLGARNLGLPLGAALPAPLSCLAVRSASSSVSPAGAAGGSNSTRSAVGAKRGRQKLAAATADVACRRCMQARCS